MWCCNSCILSLRPSVSRCQSLFMCKSEADLQHCWFCFLSILGCHAIPGVFSKTHAFVGLTVRLCLFAKPSFVWVSIANVCRANLQRYIANVWPRLALPLPNPLPAAQHPRGTHPAPRPLSRPSSAQPHSQPPTHHSRRKRAAPRGYDDPEPSQNQPDPDDSYQPHSRPASAGPSWPRQARTARNGPGAGTAAKGPGDMPAGHGRGFGGIPATSNEDSPISPRLQRNLRSRGGGSRAAKSAEQAAALRVVNWGSDQLQGSTSQGTASLLSQVVVLGSKTLTLKCHS